MSNAWRSRVGPSGFNTWGVGSATPPVVDEIGNVADVSINLIVAGRISWRVPGRIFRLCRHDKFKVCAVPTDRFKVKPCAKFHVSKKRSSMLMGVVSKQPAEKLDFDIDYSEWLSDRGGDTLASAVAAVSPAGALILEDPVVTDTAVNQWYSVGVDGVTYTITLLVTTAAGRIKENEVKVKVKEV